MRRRRPPRGPEALVGRLALLVVLAAGFLTMHGFTAVMPTLGTGGDAAVVSAAAGHGDAHVTGHAAPAALVDAVPTAPPAPSHQPGHHHDVLVACVVALVGVAVLALARLLPRTLLRPQAGLRSAGARLLVLAHDRVPVPPPRFALCVVRV